MENNNKITWIRGLWSLSPLLFFVIFYISSSIIANDFYSTPIAITFLLTLIFALFTLNGKKLNERLDIVCKGAGDQNIMLMIYIFILAGAFASGAKYIGSIDATVNLALSVLPGNFLLAGMFIASCFLSLSMGTSVGTIAALVPIAFSLAQHTTVSASLMIGLIVGGSYFGDNLSFISDTTIMATRTQGCQMKDKFKTNFRIVSPAAILSLIIYLWLGKDIIVDMPKQLTNIWLVLPYIIVLCSAIAGVNVLVVLLLGILSNFLIGFSQGCLEIHPFMSAMSDGILNLSELIIVSLMAGGLTAILRYNGGLDYVVNRLFVNINTHRKGEFSIGGLAFFANLCTANNTISILAVGSIAKEIANKCGIDAKKSASLLDTFSCFAQSIIPYGAQLLIASCLAGLGTMEIIPFLFYPFIMIVCVFISIMVGPYTFKNQ